MNLPSPHGPAGDGIDPGTSHMGIRRPDDPPAKLYVEPTSECNLRCRTCIRNSWEEPRGFMEWDLFERLAEQFAALSSAGTVVFAGFGEPLLHPRFADMVALTKEHGLRAEVISNAVLLGPELSARLFEARLDQFVVSIDGTSAESFGEVRSGASLERVVQNVRQLDRRLVQSRYSPAIPGSLSMMIEYKESIRIGIEFVAMRRNVHQLPKLQRLAARIGASFIVVSNVLPYTRELLDEALYRDVAAGTHEGTAFSPRWYLPLMDWNRETAGPLAEAFRTANHVSYLNVDLGGWSDHCPFVQSGSLAVRWDGGVSPCPPLLHSYRCYTLGREKTFTRCTFGNLDEEALGEVWNRPEYVDFRQRVLEFSFSPCVACGGCEMAEGNQEDCFGNPFPVCGDCLWARGLIRCA